MRKNKLNGNLVLGLVFSAMALSACSNGTSSSSNNQPLTSTTTPTLSGLAYDPMTKAVFSVNSQGVLCQLPVKNIPGNLNCNLVAPNNIIISSQVASDNQGNIYAIGSQATSTDNFILKYQTESNTWTVSNIDVPFVLSYSKLLYREGKLYLSDPNVSTLYTINLSTNTMASSVEFFTPGPGVIEDFDQNGNLFYTYQTNNVQPDFSVVSQTGVYTLPITSSKATGTQFGESNVYINDLVYVQNTAYACAESNFLYLPSGSGANSSWQVLTNSSQPGYFSCDYVTTDGSNLYYVEGQWTSGENYSNNYVSTLAIK
jgi:hypothetical protein